MSRDILITRCRSDQLKASIVHCFFLGESLLNCFALSVFSAKINLLPFFLSLNLPLKREPIAASFSRNLHINKRSFFFFFWYAAVPCDLDGPSPTLFTNICGRADTYSLHFQPKHPTLTFRFFFFFFW